MYLIFMFSALNI